MPARPKLMMLFCVSLTAIPELGNFEVAQAEGTQSVGTSEKAPEVLTRGPIHEAFAEYYNVEPTPGITVGKRPPEPIAEIPPEQIPEGDNVTWIPGYWAWEDEAERFIWISGLWRVVPPDQRWVPGYWAAADKGFQWISGFWTAADTGELEYFPEPPNSPESGPNVAAPSEDCFWVPGCWVDGDLNYRWRPGYWSNSHEDWVWIPQRYVWTPRGCILVNGYWDYRLSQRGVLFSPVAFHHDCYSQPCERYSPSAVVDASLILIHLFVRPGYCHYYFGDYYDQRHDLRGIRPWHSYHDHGRHYDPVFAYYHWHYGRHGTDIAGRMRSWHGFFRGHKELRPPHSLTAQADFLKRHAHDERAKHSLLGRALNDVTGRSETSHTFRRLDDGRRQHWGQVAGRIRGLETKRLEVERPGHKKADTGHSRGTRSQAHGGKLSLPALADGRRQTHDSTGRQRLSSRGDLTGPTRTQLVPNTVRPSIGRPHASHHDSANALTPHPQAGRPSIFSHRGSPSTSHSGRNGREPVFPGLRNSRYFAQQPSEATSTGQQRPWGNSSPFHRSVRPGSQHLRDSKPSSQQGASITPTVPRRDSNQRSGLQSHRATPHSFVPNRSSAGRSQRGNDERPRPTLPSVKRENPQAATARPGRTSSPGASSRPMARIPRLRDRKNGERKK